MWSRSAVLEVIRRGLRWISASVDREAPGLVLSRVERLKSELAVAPKPAGEPAIGAAHQIEILLDASEAATRGGFLRSLTNMITGADIEQAWRAIHQAQELFFLVDDEDTVRARVPDLEAAVESRLGRSSAGLAARNTA